VKVCVVAADVTWSTSGCVARVGISGVGQLLPEPTVYILLHKWIDEKTAESIQSHHGLNKVKTLHVEVLKDSLKNR